MRKCLCLVRNKTRSSQESFSAVVDEVQGYDEYDASVLIPPCAYSISQLDFDTKHRSPLTINLLPTTWCKRGRVDPFISFMLAYVSHSDQLNRMGKCGLKH